MTEHAEDGVRPSTASPVEEYGIAPNGNRLPAETRLGPVRLQVSDLGRSLDYYQRVLGFRVIHRAEGLATLGDSDGLRPLVELAERPGAASVPTNGRLGLYHFAVLLPSRGDLGRFLRHLAEIGERAGAADHLVSEALYLRDPDGFGIEVYADRPRSAWEIDGRELRMTTEPMDAQGVLAAGGSAAWAGLPAGSVIGHVHLHVGRLEDAAAFYHAALGLDRMVWSYPGALFLAAGGYHHHLGVNTWAAEAGPADEAEARLVEWTLELPDAERLEAVALSLEGAGFPVDRSGGEIVTRDPWGIQLRLRVA